MSKKSRISKFAAEQVLAACNAPDEIRKTLMLIVQGQDYEETYGLSPHDEATLWLLEQLRRQTTS